MTTTTNTNLTTQPPADAEAFLIFCRELSEMLTAEADRLDALGAKVRADIAERLTAGHTGIAADRMKALRSGEDAAAWNRSLGGFFGALGRSTVTGGSFLPFLESAARQTAEAIRRAAELDLRGELVLATNLSVRLVTRTFSTVGIA